MSSGVFRRRPDYYLYVHLAEARNNGAILPTVAVIDQQFARLQKRGEGRLDNTALIRVLSGA